MPQHLLQRLVLVAALGLLALLLVERFVLARGLRDGRPAGLAIGSHVWYRDAAPSLRLQFHELTHVRQAAERGLFGHGLRYAASLEYRTMAEAEAIATEYCTYAGLRPGLFDRIPVPMRLAWHTPAGRTLRDSGTVRRILDEVGCRTLLAGLDLDRVRLDSLKAADSLFVRSARLALHAQPDSFSTVLRRHFAGAAATRDLGEKAGRAEALAPTVAGTMPPPPVDPYALLALSTLRDWESASGRHVVLSALSPYGRTARLAHHAHYPELADSVVRRARRFVPRRVDAAARILRTARRVPLRAFAAWSRMPTVRSKALRDTWMLAMVTAVQAARTNPSLEIGSAPDRLLIELEVFGRRVARDALVFEDARWGAEMARLAHTLRWRYGLTEVETARYGPRSRSLAEVLDDPDVAAGLRWGLLHRAALWERCYGPEALPPGIRDWANRLRSLAASAVEAEVARRLASGGMAMSPSTCRDLLHGTPPAD